MSDGKRMARVVNLASDVPVVIVLAMAIPVVLVVAVALAVYGDVAKKRNRWTGLNLSVDPSEARMEEMCEEGAAPRSGLGRKGFIKRWLLLLGIGVLVSIAREFAAVFLPFGLAFALSLILAVCYAVPALVFSVKWSTERVEDAGRNGAWGLLILVPVVNIVALVVFSLLPSAKRFQQGE